MPTQEAVYPGAGVDAAGAIQTAISACAANDTALVDVEAAAWSCECADGGGDPEASFDLKSGTAGNPITVTINGTVEAKAASFVGTRDSLIESLKKSHVVLNGSGTLSGANMPVVPGEQLRHILEMRGSTNITIEGSDGLDFSEANGGDCIHIGPTETLIDDENRTPCSNITINRVLFAGAKRNNISVVSAVDLTFYRCEFTDAAGQSPQGGLVFEPESDERDQLTRVLVDECIGYGNASRDFLVATHSMDTAGGHTTPIDVTFRNCRSRRGTRVTPRAFEVQDSIASDVTGTVTFDNCRAEELNNQALYFQVNLANSVRILVNGGESRYCARTTTNRAITMILTGAPNASAGGIHLQNFAIYDRIDRDAVALTTEQSATNVTGNIRVQSPRWPANRARIASLPNLKIGRFGRLQFSNSAKARRGAQRGER